MNNIIDINNHLLQVGTGTLVESGLGFKEEGTADLRSSTEELYFMEPEKGEKLEECEKPQPVS